jgi:anti-sigma factor RsiW
MMMLSAECEAAIDQLDALRRGELAATAMSSLYAHLEACRRCTAFKAHEQAFLDRVITAARNCSCPDEVRATIYQMIAKESRDN